LMIAFMTISCYLDNWAIYFAYCAGSIISALHHEIQNKRN
jgi:hypothetical protein